MASEVTLSTRWLAFRDVEMQKAYQSYRENEISPRAFGGILLIATVVNVYSMTLATQSQYPEVTILFRILRLLFLVPGWMLVYRVCRLHKNNPISSAYYPDACHLGDITILIFTVSISLTLLVRSASAKCSDGEATGNCNPEHEYRVLPQDTTMSMAFALLACQAAVKCYQWWVMFTCWVIVFLSTIAAIVIADASNAAFVPLIVFCCGLILYEYERNVLQMYISLRNNEESIRTRMHAENEKQVTEMRSVEMRHLLGNVAHDLKTPMQSFVMDIEMVHKIIKRPVSQTAKLVSYAAHDVRKIVESLQNLTDTNSFMCMVINRAIDYAKSSAEKTLSPDLATINFVESIQWAVNVIKTRSVVPVVFEPVPDGIHPHIITDKQWLIENILCLVSNAAKFTTAGCVTVRCEVQSVNVMCENESTTSQASHASLTHTQHDLLIEVEDTGIGIPEEKRESMFQPFQQTMRMAGGTGLGLYSLRNRVEALKGTCGILGRRDGASGARIWFKIPYRPDTTTFCQCNATENEEIKESGVELTTVSSDDARASLHLGDAYTPNISPQVSFVKSCVLVVDDSPMIRKSINRVLGNEGLTVDLAENGQMALDMMAWKRYDLVLMDLQMPVMDGLEAVRRLRKRESENGDVYHQVVIGISAYNGEPYCSDALTAGMNGFIEKPFSAVRFFELCAEHGINLVLV